MQWSSQQASRKTSNKNSQPYIQFVLPKQLHLNSQFNTQTLTEYIIMYDSRSPKAPSTLKTSPKSDNSLSTGKFLLNSQLTSFELSTPCLSHITEYVSHFCQDCDYRPLCGLCLHQGMHKGHCVRNLEKGSKNVQRVLMEIMITGRTKSSLFAILHEHIEERREQIKNQVQEYIQLVSENFIQLQTLLKQKKSQLITQIQHFYSTQLQSITEALNRTKQQNQKITNMVEILNENVQKLDQGALCMFYYEKKQALVQIVQEGMEVYEAVKSGVGDLRWNFDGIGFEGLRGEIGRIGIESQREAIWVGLKDEGKGKESKKHSVLKLKRTEKVKGSHYQIGKTTGFWTPKHIESSKELQNQLKASKKMAKELRDSKKLLTLFSNNDSLEKVVPKSSESLTTLHKKSKIKPKVQKQD